MKQQTVVGASVAGGILWMLGAAWMVAASAPARDFGPFLAAWGLAAAGWAVLWSQREALSNQRAAWLFVALGVLGVRVALCASGSPRFSTDVFRYLYEGHVTIQHGWAHPFLHPPASAALTEVLDSRLWPVWARINHPTVPSIYPPILQASFAAAAGATNLVGLDRLGAWRLVLLAVELVGILVLWRSSPNPKVRFSIALLLLHPLLYFETYAEGHADLIPSLLLALGVAVTGSRPRWAAMGLSFSVAGKLYALLPLAFFLRRRPKQWPWALPGLVLVGTSAAAVGAAGLGGPTAFAASWEGGDGAFSGLVTICQSLLGGDWRRFGPVTVTSQAIARSITAVVLLLVVLRVRRHAKDPAGFALAFAQILITLLLLSPVLHPWYAIWVLVLLPWIEDQPARWCLLYFSCSIVLLHTAAHLHHQSGLWQDPWWPRAIVHVGTWGLLLRSVLRTRRGGCLQPSSQTSEPSNAPG